MDAKAQAMLTDHLGTDLAKISNELGKLLLSLPEGTKKNHRRTHRTEHRHLEGFQ
ncbi:hypothetical protein LEA_08567 [human gut metagenome]|uniref:Uncharacterized protein n=1 Tax=human gut metagenome TaxID=408170 RepID=K1T6V2_9ZZZZ